MADQSRDFWDWLQIIGPYFIGIAALLVGFKDIIINFIKRPRLKSLFDQNEEQYTHKVLFNPLEEIHDPLTNTDYIIRQPGFNSRVAIWNKGKATAKKVQVRLVDINIYNKEEDFVKRIVYHPSMVKWSGEKEYTTSDIPPDSKFFLDLFYAVNETNKEVLKYHEELGQSTLKRIIGKAEYSKDIYWNVWIDASYPRGVSTKNIIEGNFKLNFIIYAENCKPHKFKISIDWDKKTWNSPKIKVMEDNSLKPKKGGKCA